MIHRRRALTRSDRRLRNPFHCLQGISGQRTMDVEIIDEEEPGEAEAEEA